MPAQQAAAAVEESPPAPELPPVFLASVPWDPERSVSAVKLARTIPDCTITWDASSDAYDTFVRNLAAAGSGAAIFLEDDIVLTTGWAGKIAAVIAEHPDVLIQFYSNRDADLSVGSRWEPGRSFMNNQCWYAPPGMAAALADYLLHWPPRLDGSDPTGYDLAMANYLRDHELRYWLHVPSLVQHGPGKSVINPRRPHGKLRQSRTFEA